MCVLIFIISYWFNFILLMYVSILDEYWLVFVIVLKVNFLKWGLFVIWVLILGIVFFKLLGFCLSIIMGILSNL